MDWKTYIRFSIFLIFIILTIIILAYLLKLNNKLEQKANALLFKLNKIHWSIYAIFFALLSLPIHGYYFAYIDQNFYIPLIRHFINPNLYTKDYLFIQPQANLTYFINIMGLILKKFNDMETVFFITYLLFLILLFIAVYKLSYSLFKDKPVALLSLMLSLSPLTLKALGIVPRAYDSYLVPRFTSISLALFSLYLFMDDRYILSSVIASIAFILHPLTPIAVIISLFLYLLIKKDMKAFFYSMIAFLVISSPLFYKFIFRYNQYNHGTFFVNREHLYILKYIGKETWIFPLLWRFQAWIGLDVVSLLFLLVIFVKRRKDGLTKNDEKSILLFTTSLFLFLINIIFGELMPISILMHLQLLRNIIFIYWLFVIYTAYLLWHLFNEKSYIYRLLGIALTIILLRLILNKFKLSPTPMPFAPLWAGILFFIAILKNNVSSRIHHFIEQKTGKVILGSLTFITLIPPLFYISIKQYRHTIHFPHHYLTSLSKRNRAWIDAQLWAKRHTKVNALFLTPLYPPYSRPTFRVFSERSIVFTIEDNPVTLSYDYAKEYSKRYKDFKNYKNLSAKDLEDLAQKYHASYIVIEDDTPKLDLPSVYENNYFKIYKFSQND